MDRKRKRKSAAIEADWTAARCQRLLRPISSRIGPLRNLAYITDSYKPEKSLQSKSNDSSRVSKSHHAESARSSEDPAWLQRSDTGLGYKSYSTKDRARKYGGASSLPKSSKAQASTLQDGLVALPTPFRARALRKETPTKNGTEHFSSTPCQKIPVKRVKRDPFSFAPVAMQSAELHDRQTFEKVFELHQGIVDGFSLLLQKTDQKDIPRHEKGARTLFSACLRRVPNYIQAEENWRHDMDPDDETDVAAEVYEELEGLGSTVDHGWPSLREVVRAHGLKLVRDAIRSKLVSSKTRAELANIALRHDETVETERLVIAFAHSLPLKRPFNTSSPLFDGCLAGLKDAELFSTHMSSARTRIRVLDSLLSSRNLHASWIATKDVTTVISRAVRSLASRTLSEDTSHATHFLETIISNVLETRSSSFVDDRKKTDNVETYTTFNKIASPMDDAHKTISSLLTVLTAMAIIPTREDNQGNSSQQDSSQIAAALLQRLATSVLIQYMPKYRKKRNNDESHLANRTKLIILASALIMKLESSTATVSTDLGVYSLVRGIISISQHCKLVSTPTEQISSFTCQLALCCGQSLNLEACNILEDLVGNMVRQAEAETAHGQTFLRQLALESALEFATSSASREGKLFAKKMEQEMKQHGSIPVAQSPAKRTQSNKSTINSSFRWEEGLCEWIAATPLLPRAQRRAGRSDRDDSPLPTIPRIPERRQDNRGESPLSPNENTELHDSGYVSVQETPKFGQRAAKAQALLSSPDILAEEPRSLATPMQPPRHSVLAVRGHGKASRSGVLGGRGKSEPEARQNTTTTRCGAASCHDIVPTDHESSSLATTEEMVESDVRKSPPRGLNILCEPASDFQAKGQSEEPQAAAKFTKTQPLADVHIESTPLRRSAVLGIGETSCRSDEIDYDELAMSCQKPRNTVFSDKATRPTVRRSGSGVGRKDARGGVAKVAAVEESEDELV